jgi:hypothetical protein
MLGLWSASRRLRYAQSRALGEVPPWPHRRDGHRCAVAAGFDAETAVERELVLRLASLLWRLRRATAIDTGLLETPNESAPDLDGAAPVNERAAADIAQIRNLGNHTWSKDSDNEGQNDMLNFEIARRFLKLDCKSFDRLRRYETALWRQAYQVIFVLDVLRRENLDRSWLPDYRQALVFVHLDRSFAKILI